ncbi:MAG: cell division protein SepF [Ruminococcus sp.]|nr:cell division protein SepF [Ruminococcus sp.]
MKLFDTVKDFFLSADEEDEEITDTPVRAKSERSERPERSERMDRAERAERSERPYSRYSDSDADEEDFSDPARRNKVVNIQTTAQLQVVLVKPSAFTDAKQIADHLIAKKTVVLNLETASPENKRRIIDFLVGVAYANGGSLKPVANLTYIITPYNVGFIGEDLVGELENNGVFI